MARHSICQRPRPTRLLAALTCTATILVLVGGLVVTSAADTPDPVNPLTASVVVNPDGSKTLTVRGTWQWTTHHTDCNTDRYAVGWAVDWNDPNQPGNVVGTVNKVTVDVGAAKANAFNAADNAVAFYPGPAPARCGVFGPHGTTSYNTGSWGPRVHTYAADVTDIKVCVVMYDIHNAAGKGGGKKGPKGPKGGGTPEPKAGDLVAGGTGHNHDNSVQDNANTPLGNQCFLVPVPVTTTTGSTTPPTTTPPTTTPPTTGPPTTGPGTTWSTTVPTPNP